MYLLFTSNKAGAEAMSAGSHGKCQSAETKENTGFKGRSSYIELRARQILKEEAKKKKKRKEEYIDKDCF